MFPAYINKAVFNDFKADLTEYHIANGKRRSAGQCPVALALNSAFETGADDIGDLISVEVAEPLAYLFFEKSRRCEKGLAITGLLEAWIRDFDKGKEMCAGKLYIQPRTFTYEGEKIENPDPEKHGYELGIDLPDSYFEAQN